MAEQLALDSDTMPRAFAERWAELEREHGIALTLEPLPGLRRYANGAWWGPYRANGRRFAFFGHDDEGLRLAAGNVFREVVRQRFP